MDKISSGEHVFKFYHVEDNEAGRGDNYDPDSECPVKSLNYRKLVKDRVVGEGGIPEEDYRSLKHPSELKDKLQADIEAARENKQKLHAAIISDNSMDPTESSHDSDYNHLTGTFKVVREIKTQGNTDQALQTADVLCYSKKPDQRMDRSAKLFKIDSYQTVAKKNDCQATPEDEKAALDSVFNFCKAFMEKVEAKNKVKVA